MLLAFLFLKFISCELISEIYDFKLAGEDVKGCSKEKLFELKIGILTFF
jgi:hypothetical protein